METIQSGGVSADTGIVFGTYRSGNMAPALDLLFAGATSLDPRISFSRASIGTRVNASGTIETIAAGLPRFDYDPVTLKPLGLWIEESRTNLLTYSGDFSNSAWIVGTTTSKGTQSLANPDGTTNCVTLTKNSVGVSWADVTQSVSVSTGGNVGKTYTASVWIRTLSGSVNASVLISDANYNTYGSANVNVTPQWTRFSFTTSGGSGWNANGSRIGLGVNISGNGNTICVWGAQLEQGSFPTSYIPTAGAAVTRVVENIYLGDLSWFNGVAGTFVVSGDANNNLNVLRRAFTMQRNGDSTYQLSSTFAYDAAVFILADSASNSAKNAISYGGGTLAKSYGGAAAVTASGAITPNKYDRLSLGADTYAQTAYLNGHIQSLSYYPYAFSAAQLQAATT